MQAAGSCVCHRGHASQLMGDREGPSVFFHFPGIQSGIAVPPIKQWPARSGFTFSTWLRIERMPSRHGTSPYTPALYSFQTVSNQARPPHS